MLWDFVISLIHTSTLRMLPRRAISFGLVGASGVVIQLLCTFILMTIGLSLRNLPLAVITAASSNYLINNILTFGDRRQKGRQLIKGLLKFLCWPLPSLPSLANVGLATSFYNMVQSHAVLATACGNHRGLHLELRSVIALCVEHTLNHAGMSGQVMVNRPGHARHQRASGHRSCLAWFCVWCTCAWMPVVGIQPVGGQADTAAMARLLLDPTRQSGWPQIDPGSGECFTRIRGMIPLFWLGLTLTDGQIYQVFGVHEWIGRACRCCSVRSPFGLSSDWVDAGSIQRQTGWWGGMALAVAPLGVYYGRVFLVSALLIALVQQQRWKPTAFGLNDGPLGHSL